MHSDELALTGAQVVVARFPLARALTVGDSLVTSREYTFLRLESSRGLVGHAYGLTRGLPVGRIITELLCPFLDSLDLVLEPGLEASANQRLVPLNRDSSLRRGLSLLDIALWDLRAKLLNAPVWQLLPERDSEANSPRVIFVDGYVRQGEGESERAERYESWRSNSDRVFKFAGHHDYVSLANSIRQAQELLGPKDARFIVDMAWSLTDAADSQALYSALRGLNIEWIEDAAALADAERLQSVVGNCPFPTALGDEEPHFGPVEEALRAGIAQVGRLDSTTVGGLSVAAESCLRAREQGFVLSPHIYPEVHRHLSAAYHSAAYVEVFPSTGELDANQHFLDGEANDTDLGSLPRQPGLGLHLKWLDIEKYSVFSARYEFRTARNQ